MIGVVIIIVILCLTTVAGIVAWLERPSKYEPINTPTIEFPEDDSVDLQLEFDKLQDSIKELHSHLSLKTVEVLQHKGTITDLELKLKEAIDRNSVVVSQKISQSVRTGQIVEQCAPFLEQFPYKPSDVKFLGQPTDLIVFALDEDKIVFVEIKTGNAKESPKQRKIKSIIKKGNVFYEKIQINKDGVISKQEKNV